MVIFLLPVMIMELDKRCKDTGFRADKLFFSVKKTATVLRSTVAGKLYVCITTRDYFNSSTEVFGAAAKVASLASLAYFSKLFTNKVANSVAFLSYSSSLAHV